MDLLLAYGAFLVQKRRWFRLRKSFALFGKKGTEADRIDRMDSKA